MHLNLAITQEELQQYTSTAVRRGIAADLARAVKDVVASTNSRRGRAHGSNIDLTTYAPTSVIVEPGPLFADVEDIKERFDARTTEARSTKQAMLLCSICGYPACNLLSI